MRDENERGSRSAYEEEDQQEYDSVSSLWLPTRSGSERRESEEGEDSEEGEEDGGTDSEGELFSLNRSTVTSS